MEAQGYWSELDGGNDFNSLALTHNNHPVDQSPAVAALSPEFIMQVAGLYALLRPRDTEFEARVDDQLTALEAQSSVDLKSILTAKRALLGVVKTALWAKLDPSMASIGRKVEEMDSQLFSEMAELVQGLEAPDCTCGSPRRTPGGEDCGALSVQIQSLGMEFAKSAAHLSAKVASETQLLRRYQSLLTSNQVLEVQVKDYRSRLSQSKPASSEVSFLRPRDSVRKSTAAKSLTLRQLLTLISEVYVSKDKSDTRNKELGLQAETLSDHFESYLDTKYGLKVRSRQSLRERTGTALVSALEMHRERDCDVALFEKLLTHQVDEGYRDKHYRFKERVETTIRRAGKCTELTLAEAEKAIESLFPLRDKQALERILRQRYQQPAEWYRKREVTEAEFTHIVMKYRLQQYEEGIQGFRTVFEACDTDEDGRLSPTEFLRLLSLMTPAPDLISSKCWLRALDPANQQVLPFSLCFSFLSTQPGGLLNRFQSK